MAHDITAPRYFGKICEKHPELNGERRKANRKCVRCASDKMIAWAKKNREKMRAHNRASYEKHKTKHLYKRRRAAREWQINNPEKVRAHVRKWQAENKEKHHANSKNSWIRRYALIGGQTLSKIYSKEINSIYLNCPKGFEVDHIVPLRGKDVNGLHVPWNLQYLPALENRVKGNSYVG